MNKPNTYITTDTHFGHLKMIQYCYRPLDFENIILKGLGVLKDEDILIHLGDFCIGGDAYWHMRFMNEVKGRKILVKGNHDKQSNTWYYNHGWDFVCESFTDKLFGKRILFSHKPSQYTQNYELNVHGHCHNANRWKDPEVAAAKNELQSLVALEYTDYQPRLLLKIVEEFNNKPL